MDIRRSDMALLVSLDALLRDRSVSKAARRLSISQPAMSAQLAKLRLRFEDPLLVSDGHRLVPSALASDLEAPLRDQLETLHGIAFARPEFNPETAQRTFVVAATDYAHAVILPRLITHLREIAPGVRISALPFEIEGLRSRLASDVDCAIASERMIPDTLPARRILADDFALVFREHHPVAAAPIDIACFCSLAHILVSPDGGGFVGAVDQALAKLGRSRQVVASIPNFLLAQPILRQTDCVAVLPRRLTDIDCAGLVTTPLPISLAPFALIAGWHARQARDPAHVWFRNTIVELMAA